MNARWNGTLFATLVAALIGFAAPAGGNGAFRFVILGDRTGGAQAGVYEQVWREAAAEHPAFVVSVGDTIQGGVDATAQSEWEQVERVLSRYRRYPLYLVPGNHDIWSETSEKLFRKYSTHAPHYSFDFKQAHFVVLDNSRSDQFSAGEMDFLEQDLEAHRVQPVKFIFSHRPSWLLDVAMRNRTSALHQLARRFGVQYVIAGHVHEMLHLNLEGVEYVSMPSSGGHLRASGKYQDGWFFGHAVVEVKGKEIEFQIEEAKPPHGQGRITKLADWGMLGLVSELAAPASADIATDSTALHSCECFDHRAAGGSVSVGMPARYR